MNIEELKKTIEALIFVSEEPLTVKHLREILKDEDHDLIDFALNEAIHEFNGRDGGLEIRELAGGYRMSTRPEMHEQVRTYFKDASLRTAIAGSIGNVGCDCLQTAGNNSGNNGDSWYKVHVGNQDVA